jgi:hypothetical protein
VSSVVRHEHIKGVPHFRRSLSEFRTNLRFCGQTNVPGGLANGVAIAAGDYHSLDLTTLGRVVAWGVDWSGQTDVPGGLGNVLAIAGGGVKSLPTRPGCFAHATPQNPPSSSVSCEGRSAGNHVRFGS